VARRKYVVEASLKSAVRRFIRMVGFAAAVRSIRARVCDARFMGGYVVHRCPQDIQNESIFASNVHARQC